MKEIDTQVQEVQRVPQKMNQKKLTQKYIIIKMAKIKDREETSKAAREKISYLQVSSLKTVSWFLNRNITGQKGLAWNIQSDKKQGLTTKITLPSKAII